MMVWPGWAPPGVGKTLASHFESLGGHLELLRAEGDTVKVLLSAPRQETKAQLRDMVDETLRAQLGGPVRVEVVENLPIFQAIDHSVPTGGGS
jgi:hypothetical protein